MSDARLALLEPKVPPPPGDDVDIRVSALSRASERILDRADAWRHIASEHRCAYERMTVWDASDRPTGRSALHFSAAQSGEPNLGYIVENRRVQWALFESVPLQQRVTVFRATLDGLQFESECVRVTLSDRRTLRVRLVLAADGAQSPCREMAGIRTDGWRYEQSAVVTHVRTELPHRHTAWQRFTASGPVAFLPLNDGRSSIVWTNPTAEAERLVVLPDEQFAAELERASDRVLGRVDVAARRASFPLQLRAARDYTKPRFALLGDAAHAVHPLAGQGVNLGFMDAATLVETFAQARRQGATLEALGEPKILRRYERWRKSENLAAMGLMDGINRLFSNDRAVLAALRRAGLATVEHAPGAKRFFVRRALGVGGERPRMLD